MLLLLLLLLLYIYIYIYIYINKYDQSMIKMNDQYSKEFDFLNMQHALKNKR